MTFKLTEKDIAAIESILTDHSNGMVLDDIACKHKLRDKRELKAFAACLRRLGISLPYQKKGLRAGSDGAKRTGDAVRKRLARTKGRLAALREFEAREAAR